MLHSLGLKLAESLRKLSSAPSVDDALVKGVLKDVSSALLEADVRALRAPAWRAARALGRPLARRCGGFVFWCARGAYPLLCLLRRRR